MTESIFSNACHRVAYGDRGEILAAKESIFSDAYYGIGYGDRGEIIATVESSFPNACYGVAYGDRGEMIAFIESFFYNACHGIGYGDRGEIPAISESMFPNACHFSCSIHVCNYVRYVYNIPIKIVTSNHLQLVSIIYNIIIDGHPEIVFHSYVIFTGIDSSSC